MIVGALLRLVGSILDLVGRVLPVSVLPLPASTNIASWVGQYAGPIDRWFPLVELFTALDLLFSIWLPVMLIYTVTTWIYKHLPVIGAG